MRSSFAVALLMPAMLALGCQSPPTAVIVKVSADPDVTGIYQLQAILSNAETSDEKIFPETKGQELVFDTAFSLTLDGGRTGTLDVALTGLASGGALWAYGDGSVEIDPGHTVTLPITLHQGVTTCGDNVVDGDDECDDGNRITDGTCDFRCRNRAGGAGGAGGGGAGGAGGGAGGAAGGPCMVPLLNNGNFDQGNTGWTAIPADRPMIARADEVATTTNLPIQAFSSPYIAWLGYDLLSAEVMLRQTFTIPADATSLIVSGYRQIRTDEGGCECDFGYVDVTVGGELMAELHSWSALDAGTGWAYFTDTIPLATHPGPDGAIALRAKMDDGVNTSFFFDSISVTAVRCP
jgi:hypothetical protein